MSYLFMKAGLYLFFVWIKEGEGVKPYSGGGGGRLVSSLFGVRKRVCIYFSSVLGGGGEG